MVYLPERGGVTGQRQCKLQPVAVFTFYRDVAAMAFDDAVADRKAKARAFTGGFGREKGVENPWQVLSSIPCPVSDTSTEIRLPAFSPVVNFNGAVAGHRMDGVHQQVDEHLLDLFFIHKHRGSAGAKDGLI
jgi:hypothetical protein